MGKKSMQVENLSIYTIYTSEYTYKITITKCYMLELDIA